MLAFSNDYYGMIFRATQSVELFCAYVQSMYRKSWHQYSTSTKWLKDLRESSDISVRGSGNYSSDDQKETSLLKRKSRDLQDAHVNFCEN